MGWLGLVEWRVFLLLHTPFEIAVASWPVSPFGMQAGLPLPSSHVPSALVPVLFDPLSAFLLACKHDCLWGKKEGGREQTVCGHYNIKKIL